MLYEEFHAVVIGYFDDRIVSMTYGQSLGTLCPSHRFVALDHEVILAVDTVLLPSEFAIFIGWPRAVFTASSRTGSDPLVSECCLLLAHVVGITTYAPQRPQALAVVG